jgi:hypothetical protein
MRAVAWRAFLMRFAYDLRRNNGTIGKKDQGSGQQEKDGNNKSAALRTGGSWWLSASAIALAVLVLV